MGVPRPLVAILVAALIATLPGCALRRQAKLKRENAYQAAVESYSNVLKPGTTRKEVEDYLKAKNVQFSQMGWVEKEDRTAYSDLIYIAKEHAPWYCEKHNVYVAFSFKAVEVHKPWEARDSDILKEITVFHWLLGCL